MQFIIKSLGVIFLGIVFGITIALLFALPVSWAWNYTMPYLFHLPTIGVLKAFCLVFLSGALIKSNLIHHK